MPERDESIMILRESAGASDHEATQLNAYLFTFSLSATTSNRQQLRSNSLHLHIDSL
jgi:hypothetical protein